MKKQKKVRPLISRGYRNKLSINKKEMKDKKQILIKIQIENTLRNLIFKGR